MIVSNIIYILFIHWIADFIAQTDYIAKNKSKSIKVLSEHIIVYFLILYIASIPLFGIKVAFSFAFINSVLHFCIDYVTSRIVSYYFNKNDTHNAFVVIGFDQFLHVSILLISAKVML